MTKILNLNPVNTGLPFKWYPLTELFRDFLREKTLPEGLCIIDSATDKMIFIDEGVDRDIFIDNFLVSDFSLYMGKRYAKVALDDIVMLGRESVNRRIFEAIEKLPELKKNPFVTENQIYDLLQREVMYGSENFAEYLDELEPGVIEEMLALLKLIFVRLGDRKSVDEILGKTISSFTFPLEYDTIASTMKIAALMLEDKRSAEKLFNELDKTENSAKQKTETAALGRYILNKKTDTAKVFQECFAAVENY